MSSFGFAKAVQTVRVGNVPLPPKSVSCWAAGTNNGLASSYHSLALCALERILNVYTEYMLKYS